MLFFTFIKGGVTPLTGPPNLNVNKKMVFFNEGFPNFQWPCSNAKYDEEMHCNIISIQSKNIQY